MKPPELPPGFYLKEFTASRVWLGRDQWSDPERAMDFYLGLPDVEELTSDMTGMAVTLLAMDAYNPDEQSFPTRIFSNINDPLADEEGGWVHPYHAIAWAVMDIWQHELWEFMRVDGERLFEPHGVGGNVVREMPYKMVWRKEVNFDGWR